MSDDAELLRRYVTEKSEEAFAELVRQHLGFVYHTALRQLNGDLHAAEDVAQLVFTDLARKAPSLVNHQLLAGWLHTSTQYTAMNHRRTERRRHAREQEAHLMQELTRETAPLVDWEQIRPVIDDTLRALGPIDREAIILRFFEGRAFAEVGARLKLSEDGARSRVERALDKMHTRLTRRGVVSTVAALSVTLTGHAAAVPPAGLAGSVASYVMAAAASGESAVSHSWWFFVWGKKGLVTIGAIGVLVLAPAYVRTSSPMSAMIVQHVDASPEFTMQAVLNGIGDGIEDYLAASRKMATLKPAEVRLFRDASREVEPNAIIFLDLGAAEVTALNRHYRETRQEIQEMFNRSAKVEPGPDSLQIEYRLDTRELERLGLELDAVIVKSLDRSSAVAYAKLDKTQLVFLNGIGSVTRVAQPFGYSPPKPDTLGEAVVTVSLAWTGKGPQTKYTASVQTPVFKHGSTASANWVLDQFYGDVVRKHRPEIVSERRGL